MWQIKGAQMELGHPPLSYGQSPKELVEREREGGRKRKIIRIIHQFLLYKTLD